MVTIKYIRACSVASTSYQVSIISVLQRQPFHQPVSRNRLFPNKFIPRVIYSGIDYHSGIVYHPLE